MKKATGAQRQPVAFHTKGKATGAIRSRGHEKATWYTYPRAGRVATAPRKGHTSPLAAAQRPCFRRASPKKPVFEWSSIARRIVVNPVTSLLQKVTPFIISASFTIGNISGTAGGEILVSRWGSAFRNPDKSAPAVPIDKHLRLRE